MDLAGIEPAKHWAVMRDLAAYADGSEWDSLWVYDHFHNVPRPAHETVFECWTTLAAISQRTSRIKLGQMVGCAPYRNPALLAKITSGGTGPSTTAWPPSSSSSPSATPPEVRGGHARPWVRNRTADPAGTAEEAVAARVA